MRISSRLSSIIVAACLASTTVFAVGADFTVGFIPKLDTDPYFKATGEGAAEAQKEIGGKSLLVALPPRQERRRFRSLTTCFEKSERHCHFGRGFEFGGTGIEAGAGTKNSCVNV